MTNLFDLTGKKAIVTGGTRGLGHGMAEALLEAGCEAVIIGNSSHVQKAAQHFREQGLPCHGVQADLCDRSQVDRGFEEALSYLNGDVDILVTAAGIQRRYSAEEFPTEAWDQVIEVNLNAVFRMCQLAGNVMLPKEYGKIITVGSMISFFGGSTICAYAASKGGVAQLTKALSNDWAGRGICVNCIAPGYMATEMNQALLDDPQRLQAINARIPAGRWGTEQDVKGAVIFLASQASDYITGAILPVDGGYLVK